MWHLKNFISILIIIATKWQRRKILKSQWVTIWKRILLYGLSKTEQSVINVNIILKNAVIQYKQIQYKAFSSYLELNVLETETEIMANPIINY